MVSRAAHPWVFPKEFLDEIPGLNPLFGEDLDEDGCKQKAALESVKKAAKDVHYKGIKNTVLANKCWKTIVELVTADVAAKSKVNVQSGRYTRVCDAINKLEEGEVDAMKVPEGTKEELKEYLNGGGSQTNRHWFRKNHPGQSCH